MNREVEKFIRENIDLIQGQKWEEIYQKNIPQGFTETLLECGVNPLAQGLSYMPEYFLYNSEIKEFIIPNSVTSIGKGAFYYCTSLTSIKIPNSVTSIGSYVFRNCSKLTSITMGNSVTSIGNYAFSSCDSLTEVNYLGTIDQWVQIRFDGAAANPLAQEVRLYIDGQLVNELVIPNNVTKISAYAFNKCTSLTSIVIGNSVTSIGEEAFYRCISLKSVTIPSSIKSIHDSAFWSCPNLKEIKYLGTKREAMQLGIRDRSNAKWIMDSSIQKIVCTDGIIDL